MTFTKLWKILQITPEDYFIKSEGKLSEKEIHDIQEVIRSMQEKGKSASIIIKYLQDHNKKIAEKYQSERVFYTELKRLDTQQVKTAGKYLDLDQYKVILSPHACEICRKKTDNGKKIFTAKDLAKSGYGQFVPWHPNCYCVAVPV